MVSHPRTRGHGTELRMNMKNVKLVEGTVEDIEGVLEDYEFEYDLESIQFLHYSLTLENIKKTKSCFYLAVLRKIK